MASKYFSNSRQSRRQPHQYKPAQKGQQSKRGVPELYDELKQPRSYGLTSTAKEGIDALAKDFDLSASEFIERIGRGIFNVVPSKAFTLTQDLDPTDNA